MASFFTPSDTKKIIWTFVSIFVAVGGWILITLFNLNASIAIIKSDGDNRLRLQEKMWSKIEENNKLLATKADENENQKAHLALMEQLIQLGAKVDRSGYRTRTSLVPRVDTLRKDILLTSVKLDTLKKILTKESGEVPYKTRNDLVMNTNN